MKLTYINEKKQEDFEEVMQRYCRRRDTIDMMYQFRQVHQNHKFLPLKNVANKDVIEIVTKDRRIREYQVHSIERAKPNEIAKLQSPDHTVVLFTCDIS